MSKTKDYSICIQFQERGNLHVRLFVLIFKTPCTEHEAVYADFIDKTLNSQLLDHLNNPELSEQLKTIKLMITLEHSGDKQ